MASPPSPPLPITSSTRPEVSCPHRAEGQGVGSGQGGRGQEVLDLPKGCSQGAGHSRMLVCSPGTETGGQRAEGVRSTLEGTRVPLTLLGLGP